MRLFSMTLSAMVLSVCASSAQAFDCEISRVKSESGVSSLVIAKGTGENRRLPTLEEVFDAMNGSITLLEDLRFDSSKPEQPKMHVRLPSKELVQFSLKTLPKKEKGDPACKDKKITGYECRVRQMRGLEEYGGLPEGIKTPVAIQIPESEMGIFDRVTSDLGCEKTLFANGMPVSAAAAAKTPIKIKPAGGTQP